MNLHIVPTSDPVRRALDESHGLSGAEWLTVYVVAPSGYSWLPYRIIRLVGFDGTPD